MDNVSEKEILTNLSETGNLALFVINKSLSSGMQPSKYSQVYERI